MSRLLSMLRPCLAVLLVSLLVAEEPGAVTPNSDLLDTILAAQATRTRLTATLRQDTVRADEPDGEPTSFRLQLWLEAPDRYHLLYRPVGDDEMCEWFLSDGRTRWHVEQTFADEAPSVRSSPVEQGEGSAGRFVRLLRLDRASLEADFDLSAEADIPAAERRSDQATARIVCVPRSADLQADLRRAVIEFDAQHRPLVIEVLDARDNLVRLTILSFDDQVALPDNIFVWPSAD